MQGLRVGDRIIDVNGTDFTHLTHAEAVTMMRNAWNIIMTVESDSVTGTSLYRLLHTSPCVGPTASLW